MAGNFQQIGEQFVQQYYQMFDSNRQSLTPLYNETSMLSFEGEQFQGAQSIVQKLASLPFQQVKHQVVKADCQPSPPNSIMIFVTGSLFVDNNPQPLKFSETFILGQTPQGGYFCQNDIFRLNA
eukprot:TRINITY_DN800_c0_g1_i1.p1 TRINITY_DN800_c0_g1~~TRINITY_DN800_c0_g1_i1.p1  ORF type:complete len:124 (-),score=26.40 TRINITY_DN800_c0_g1_i1:252-623(-)